MPNRRPIAPLPAATLSAPSPAGARQAPTASRQRLPVEKVGGRPPKFGEPSRPVTLTLPESTLADLAQIDPDRATAIVKLTNAAMKKDGGRDSSVEVLEMVVGKGLLVIGPCQALRRIPFLHLIEVAPGRFLLALESGHDFRALELAVRDLLDDLPPDRIREQRLLTDLLANVARLRKADRVTMAEILLVTLDGKKKRVR